MRQGFRFGEQLSESGSGGIVGNDLIDFGEEVCSSSLASTYEQIFQGFWACDGTSSHGPSSNVKRVEEFRLVGRWRVECGSLLDG